jgi:hypothetical protein
MHYTPYALYTICTIHHMHYTPYALYTICTIHHMHYTPGLLPEEGGIKLGEKSETSTAKKVLYGTADQWKRRRRNSNLGAVEAGREGQENNTAVWR